MLFFISVFNRLYLFFWEEVCGPEKGRLTLSSPEKGCFWHQCGIISVRRLRGGLEMW